MESQSERVLALVAREPSLEGDQPSVGGWLQRMCRAATRDLPASGVGVSLLSDEGDLLTAAASGHTSVLVEEPQFTLGEGPCIAAFRSRSPVLVPDLSLTAATTWPGYAPAAHEHGVRAVFAFPLMVGAARLGALDIYRDRTGSLSSPEVARALTFAEVSINALLDAQARDADGEDVLVEGASLRFEVYQAQGMLMVQLSVSSRDALVRLRALAYAQNRRIGDVADDVIAGRLVMEPEEPGRD